MENLYLFRKGVQVSSKDNNGNVTLGERGELYVQGIRFYTIERRDGFLQLPKGRYECVMEVSEKVGRMFRVAIAGHYGHNLLTKAKKPAAMLIHTANFPHQVEGCVAPGLSITRNGVEQSAKAMDEIFQLCGGFGLGKKVWLMVDDTEAFSFLN